MKRLALTIALSCIGGAIFSFLGFPAGWLVGGMAAVATATIAGLPTRVPGWTSALNAVIFGASLGSAVTMDAVAALPEMASSLFFLFISLVASILACSLYLERVHHWPEAEARFTSIPGALTSVLLLANEAGASMPHVAVGQIVRQFVLVLSMPVILYLLPDAGTHETVQHAAAAPVAWLDLVLMLDVGAAFGKWLERLSVPGGLLLGSMIGSAGLHLSGIVTTPPPGWLMIAIFVVTGAMIGTRFNRFKPSDLLRLLRPALESVVVAMAVAGIIALIASAFTSFDFASLWLAYAPGGVETMIAVSVALSLEVVAVSLHHFVRLLLLNLLAPLWMPRQSRTPSILQENR